MRPRRLIDLEASAARIGHHLLQAGAAARRRALPAAGGRDGGRRRRLPRRAGAGRRGPPARHRRAAGRRRCRCGATCSTPSAIRWRRRPTARRSTVPIPRPSAACACGWPAARVMSGDLETAAAALDGLETDGGADDADILLARGKYAFFTSDFDDGPGGGRGGPATGARRRAQLEGARSRRPPGPARPPLGELVRPDAASSCAGRGRTPRSPTPSSTATCARPSTCSTGRRPTPRSSAWPATCRRPPGAAVRCAPPRSRRR